MLIHWKEDYYISESLVTIRIQIVRELSFPLKTEGSQNCSGKGNPLIRILPKGFPAKPMEGPACDIREPRGLVASGQRVRLQRTDWEYAHILVAHLPPVLSFSYILCQLRCP